MKRIYILTLGLLSGLAACSDWLDIQPKTSLPADKLFESESGFKDALTGFYIKMGDPVLYGKELTFGYLELAAANYDEYPGMFNMNVYDYDNVWRGMKDGIYAAMYNIIANINNFLKYLEMNREVVKTEKYYELMKGEALGLRAYLHFDLLRLFGPVYSENTWNDKAISYRERFDRKADPILPACRVVERILEDLHAADSLLELSDPRQFEPVGYEYNAFESIRQVRMNLYAVKATMARVYCYAGDEESKRQAVKYAREVIESEAFRLYDSRDHASNAILFAEHIFGLNVYELGKKLEEGGLYKTQLPVNDQINDGVYILSRKERFAEQYQTASLGTTDFRADKNSFKEVEQKKSKLCLKYDQTGYGEETWGKSVIPLIRLPEMYYILAECETDPEKSAEALNTVRWQRGIAYEDGIQADDAYDKPDVRKGEDAYHTVRINEIMREYRKEFFSEGLLYYFYKRHNYETFPYLFERNKAERMRPEMYRWPLPDNEVTFGNNN